jgi:hypothetical protein
MGDIIYSEAGEAAFCEAVCDVLDGYGIEANYEHPGYINFSVAGFDVAVGTATGESWGADWGLEASPGDPREGEGKELPLSASVQEVADYCVGVTSKLKAKAVEQEPGISI